MIPASPKAHRHNCYYNQRRRFDDYTSPTTSSSGSSAGGVNNGPNISYHSPLIRQHQQLPTIDDGHNDLGYQYHRSRAINPYHHFVNHSGLRSSSTSSQYYHHHPCRIAENSNYNTSSDYNYDSSLFPQSPISKKTGTEIRTTGTIRSEEKPLVLETAVPLSSPTQRGNDNNNNNNNDNNKSNSNNTNTIYVRIKRPQPKTTTSINNRGMIAVESNNESDTIRCLYIGADTGTYANANPNPNVNANANTGTGADVDADVDADADADADASSDNSIFIIDNDKDQHYHCVATSLPKCINITTVQKPTASLVTDQLSRSNNRPLSTTPIVRHNLHDNDNDADDDNNNNNSNNLKKSPSDLNHHFTYPAISKFEGINPNKRYKISKRNKSSEYSDRVVMTRNLLAMDNGDGDGDGDGDGSPLSWNNVIHHYHPPPDSFVLYLTDTISKQVKEYLKNNPNRCYWIKYKDFWEQLLDPNNDWWKSPLYGGLLYQDLMEAFYTNFKKNWGNKLFVDYPTGTYNHRLFLRACILFGSVVNTDTSTNVSTSISNTTTATVTTTATAAATAQHNQQHEQKQQQPQNNTKNNKNEEDEE